MKIYIYITVKYISSLGMIEDYILISLLSIDELKGYKIDKSRGSINLLYIRL